MKYRAHSNKARYSALAIMLAVAFPVLASLSDHRIQYSDTAAISSCGAAFANAYDPAGNLTNRADGAGNTVRYAYDALDRLVARYAFSREGHEKHETFAYDAVGNLLAASNEAVRLSFTYDVMDRLATATTVLSNATFTAAYARDAGGLATNLVYAAGKSVTRSYDADGRLATVSDWLGHTWHFAWDGAGNPTGGTSPGGIAATNRYDAAGRLEAWSVGTLAGRTVTRDAAGLKTREDVTAGPHPAPAFVRYATNTFDAADRLVSASVRYGSHTNAAVAETYHYDGNGALTNLVFGSNRVFTAAYSPLGQLSSLICGTCACEAGHLRHLLFTLMGTRMHANELYGAALKGTAKNAKIAKHWIKRVDEA